MSIKNDLEEIKYSVARMIDLLPLYESYLLIKDKSNAQVVKNIIVIEAEKINDKL